MSGSLVRARIRRRALISSHGSCLSPGRLLHAHQVPAAVSFLPASVKSRWPFFIALVRIALRRPGAAVPDHHRAAAVLALRDGALEVVVFDRMILDVDGEPLVARHEARAARHRPAHHHAVELEPQVVVQPRRGVLLDDEAGCPCAARLPAARLRGDAEVALLRGRSAARHESARVSSAGALQLRRVAAARLRACAVRPCRRGCERGDAPLPPFSALTLLRSASIRLMTLLGFGSGAFGSSLAGLLGLDQRLQRLLVAVLELVGIEFASSWSRGCAWRGRACRSETFTVRNVVEIVVLVAHLVVVAQRVAICPCRAAAASGCARAGRARRARARPGPPSPSPRG